MGVRNRERRKAKQKARARRNRPHAGAEQDLGALAAQIEQLAVTGVLASTHGADHEFEECVSELTGPPGDSPALDELRDLIDWVLFDCLRRAITVGWTRGWQPQDVTRVVERHCGPRHARLAADVMIGELRQYAPATVHERFTAQLRALDAQVWWEDDGDYVRLWGARARLDRAATIRHLLQVLREFSALPELPQLCPPPGAARNGSLGGARNGSPGAARDGSPDGRDAEQRMLARVRALLAKAESTEFPEEADAFTAKAQELMARHSIDYALLAADQGSRELPVGIRIGIDNPYEAPKSTLLAQVAAANRCEAVWSPALGFSTVLGYPADLESVEVLYTSLLVQATAAMMREGSRSDAGGRSRTRSFRQSFLNAYAVRIGERLREATEEASRVAVSEEGRDRLLPVLAARDDAVRESVRTMFPAMEFKQISATNMEGWASGTAAADLASLPARGQLSDG